MAATGTRAPLGMPMDVYRAGDGSYHVEADLPGVDPDSIEVTVEHSTLTIRAERTPHYGESEQVIVAERPQGSFTRQLSLGEGVDSENLTAAYADGVLHLIIPVSPKTQARRVEITHAPGGSRTIHHAIRAGTGLGPVENDELAQPDGAQMACCRRRAIPGIAAPRRDRCPKPAQAHRIAGVEVLCASTVPRKSCR
jgi:HSP20 family protein